MKISHWITLAAFIAALTFIVAGQARIADLETELQVSQAQSKACRESLGRVQAELGDLKRENAAMMKIHDQIHASLKDLEARQAAEGRTRLEQAGDDLLRAIQKAQGVTR